LTVLPEAFLIANIISLPVNKPIKHHVVDMGTFDIILNTNKTAAYYKSIKVASGI